MQSEENGNVLILPTPIPTCMLMTLLTTPIFDFHKVNSTLATTAYNSNSDSIANENQP